MDSTGILELIGYISDEFEIHVEDDKLVTENLDSLNNVTAYIGRKVGEAAAAAAV